MRIDLFVVRVAVGVEEFGANEFEAAIIVETSGVLREAAGNIDLLYLLSKDIVLV